MDSDEHRMTSVKQHGSTLQDGDGTDCWDSNRASHVHGHWQDCPGGMPVGVSLPFYIGIGQSLTALDQSFLAL